MRFRTKLLLGNGSILLLMVIIAIVVYYSIVSLIKTSAWVEHTYRAIGHGKEIAKLIVDMETGERGFLITGREEYLEPYNSGKDAFEKYINKTNQLVSDNPVQVSRLERIHDLKMEWLQNVVHPEIAMRREMNKNTVTMDDVIARIDRGTGKNIMDTIRVEFESFINTELNLLQQRKSRAVKMSSETVRWVTHTYEVIVQAKEMEKLVVDMETAERGFLITGRDEYLEPYHKGKAKLDKLTTVVKKLVSDNPAQVKQMGKIEKMIALWIENAALPEIAIRREMDKNTVSIKDVSRLLESGRGKTTIDGLRARIDDFINAEKSLVTRRESTSRATAKTAIAITIIGTLIALILGGLIAYFATRSLFLKIGGEPEEIDKIARNAAVGDLTLEFSDSKRLTGIFSSLYILIESLNRVVVQANLIAQGDYSKDVVPRSEDDTLGNALDKMTKTLRQLTAESEEQNWFKTGQTLLNDKMLGEKETDNLTQLIIDFVSDYLRAQVGAFYLLKSDRLVLTSSYAYQIRNTTTNELRIGEGLVGQAAREKKSILFTAIPDDHVPLTINSGLGEYKARCIVATPLLYSDRLFGVIALGTAGEFTEAQLEFLNLVSENIGISLNSALARTEMQELLAESRRQAEELQSQQEALRVANEELEEQTKALTESQHRLQTQRKELTSSNEKLELQKRTLEEQQEELRVINEELETQTQALEVQSAATETQNLELEQARQSLEEKATALETASKYKSEFLANMSHELRTPLNSLLILAELLKENERGHLSEKEVGFAETIHNSGTELLNLINDVLDLAKVESGKMEVHPGDVPLDELAQYVGYNFQHQAEEKGLTLVVENDDDVPDLIFTDYQKVLQIVKNLLSNAVKFTDQGSISFRISRPDAKADFSDVSLDPENAIAMTVSDTGVGIPQDKWDSVFEAFQQADGSTSRKYGGTGLGLSISRELAKNLGGKLTLQSEKGEGSTFILYLPLRFESTPRSAVSPSDRAESLESGKELRELSGEQTEQEVETDSARQAVHHQPAKDERENVSPGQPSIDDRLLLIIEDDPHFAKIVLDLAQEKGFNGLIAEDGEIGLQMARDLKPLAIILDIGLPKMDGWMVMEKLKTTAETRHIPVHFISAMDKDIRAMKMGAIGFLTKPISRRDLEDAFSKIEATIAQKVKRLLIVEDDQTLRKSMVALIENMDVHIDAVSSGEEAYQLLGSQDFDCLVLDLGLRDMSGLDLLEKINNRGSLVSLPVIIYTGKELSEEEERQLMAYSDSIIIKGAGSMERLLGEMTLFLHQVETDLPSEQQRMLQKAYDKDQVLNGKVVLLVDDDVRSSFALSNRLEASNIKVVRAFDGEEALKTLDDQPEVDLVLMDVMMPTMDGYETMREIRKQDRFRKLPIIALTAKAMKDDRDKCLEAGANDYLPKPIDTVKLISLLRVWLF